MICRHDGLGCISDKCRGYGPDGRVYGAEYCEKRIRATRTKQGTEMTNNTACPFGCTTQEEHDAHYADKDKS